MKKLILIGGGGHCHSCIDAIEMQGEYTIIGIIDTAENAGKDILGYKIIGTDENIPDMIKKSDYYFLVTLGQIKSPKRRMEIFQTLENHNAKIAIIISPLAYISKHSTVGAGTIVLHGAIVNANAKIGKNCIINSRSLIEHDVVIESHCHISTGAILNGNVFVKTGTFFGSNSTTKEGAIIEENSVIPAQFFFKKNI